MPEAGKRPCLLEQARPCTDCGECDRCDLDKAKLCDNCCRCLGEADYRAIIVTGIERRPAASRIKDNNAGSPAEEDDGDDGRKKGGCSRAKR